MTDNEINVVLIFSGANISHSQYSKEGREKNDKATAKATIF